MSVEEKLSLVKVSYHVSIKSVKLLWTATITPVVKIHSDQKRGVIVDFKVDGHELLPTAKLRLDHGASEHTLKSVQIRRRLSAASPEQSRDESYKMELRVSPDGDKFVTDERVIELKS